MPRIYHTGLIVSRDDCFPVPRCCGAGWEALIQPFYRDPERLGVVIRAGTQRNAQNAIELIWASLHICQLGGIDLYDYPEVVPAELTEDDDPWLTRNEFPTLRADRGFLQTSGIPWACAIAARASRRKDFSYAVHLLALSQSLVPVHAMDMEPMHWRDGPAVSPYGRDHVRFAYSLISAYAAIEQIGLEVRASATRPTFIDGAWNPAVRSDLEKRLQAAGVDLGENAVWIRRGTPRRTEVRRPVRSVARQPWSTGAIRDVEVALIDAIADLSWLRSKISSHRVSEDVGSLAIYDVHNAQYLARRLILTSLGFWRKQYTI
jgi:hypothetical protein